MLKRSLSVILAFTILISLFTYGPGASLAAAPDQPGVTMTTTNSVSLSWPAVQGAASYNVYRSLSSNGVFAKVNTSDISLNNYADSGLDANTRYYYKVSSVSAGIESALSVEASSLTQPDFGPNVYVFDPTTPAADIQTISTDVFTKQEKNQFGSERYALLFKPGSYNANIRMGFYTQVSGLGQLPDDVTINGGVTVDADWAGSHNATQNFWRSIENLAVAPSSGDMKWAVSQAAPMRRLHVKGNLTLHDQGGWASGGFLADTVVDGTVTSGSQQQWFSRNSKWATWSGSVWNTTIVGSVNAPVENWPTNAFTIVDKTPVIREKPFLTFDAAANQYKVFVPSVATNTSGTSWASGSTAGTSIPIENFFIANPATPVASINSALDQGKNLLFTPGVYHLTDTIRVTKPDTVVLGLGLATLHSDNGIVALSVADVDGVKIAGLLFEAGSVSSPVLLQLGPKGSSTNHVSNPSSLHDLFFRVGGDALAKAEVCIEINSNNVIGDHFWVWRADHGTGAAWNSNTTTNGMVVNGNDVTIYGLFVEHFHQYQTVWNGDRGKMYFYQTEIPYDVPDQDSWMSSSGTVNGYASYKVGDSVTSHEAYGLGIYSFFRDAEVKLESGIEIPDKAGVKIHHATSVYLSGFGEITHIANAMGTTVKKGAMRATLGDYIPRTVASITSVSLSTITGKAPVLPAVVTQIFNDSTTKQAVVTWESIAPSQYASTGSFTVNGTVTGTSIKAVANVTVAAAPNVAVTDIVVSGAGNAKAITTKDGTLQMSAVVTPANADNAAVTWSIVSSNGTATNLASISSGGLLTAMKDGTVKVIATANDGSGVTASQVITISGQTVKVSNITVSGQNSVTEATYKGATLQMLADVQPLNATDRTFTWSVINGTGTATIDTATGVLKALSDGTVSVIATAKDGSGTTGQQTITISGQSLVLGNGWTWINENRDNWAITPMNPNAMKLTTIEGSWGGTKPSNILLRDPGTTGDFTISTKLSFAATNNYEWAGLIIYQDDGKLNTLISLGRQANGNPASKQIRFSQVKTGTQTDKSYTDPVAPGDVYLRIDKVGTTYKGFYSADGVNWTQVADTFTLALTNPKVGIFDRKLGGNAAKTAEFSEFNLSGTVVPYWSPVQSVSVTGEGGAGVITSDNGALQMSAQVLPLNASSNSVTWSVYNVDSSATDKATISTSGLLTAVKNGQVKVVAKAYDGSGVIGSAIIDISGQVNTPPTIEAVSAGDGQVTIGWSPMSGAVTYSVYQRTADGFYGTAASTVSGNVYSYNATGLENGTTYYFVVKAVYPGKVSEASNEVSATPQAPVPNIAVTGITLNQSSFSLTKGDSSVLTATVLPTNAANQAVTWSSSNINVAKVDANGNITAISSGSAIITATTADGGFTATCSVTVYAQQTGGGGGVGGSPYQPATDTVLTVTTTQLSNNQNGTTIIEVPTSISEIRLPANTADLINSNHLEIKSDALSLSIPSEVFKQLTDKLTVDELKGGMISLKLDVIAKADAKDLIHTINLSANSENKLAGDVYEFHLFIQTSNGKIVELSKFNKPITIELKNPVSMNPKLVGIYYIADDGTLTYVGGKLHNDFLAAEISHFSKYAVIEVTKTFADVPSGHWASNVIKELAAKQFVNGTSATTFEPERSVTRAEFTALLVRALNLTEKGATVFSDVQSGDWYADAVSVAVKAGIVQGKLAALFDPNAPITREEMVTMLLRAYEYKYGKVSNKATHSFADEDQISSWATEFVQTAATLDLIQGRGADKFDPKGISTRAEAAQILFNLLVATKAL
ncbi:Ig-like domain-containing protein [Paenibacillus aceris]|uniref:Uncharacterized protein YjdB/regulation of enolase protein 1 (Concanavalin A-like superfamily) n=1 Tax=Paenibacillus aceris TaxID=869555 RepID=A0ABS4IA80_9BACL|nr:Ig-like domain-containing protein [Paenibacillus aceris]MBP1967266.1 uncharacterized protein YjdB/regulation of enolase protein 1 (concanavalin A-like superfamily) [Paenibacillus aceris]NHW33556.1 hypothetical protein [Paenibacillus aceris]